jgi:prenyltransferase beta subunit/Zn-dependent protease with chaperone function
MNEQESSARALLLFLLVVPLCLVVITVIAYDISYAVTGQYSFTFSREYIGWTTDEGVILVWTTGDGAEIVWIPSYVTGLLLEIFPLVILLRAYLLRSSTRNLRLLEDSEVCKIAHEAAEVANIDPPPLYIVTDNRMILDVFGTNKKPLLKLSSRFIDLFREKPKELKALLLHEYSHILNRDLRLLTLRSSFIHVLRLYLLVGFFYQCFNMYLYAAEHVEISPFEMGTRMLFLTFRTQFVLFMTFVFLYLLVNSIYREREFLADMKTRSIMKDSIYLVSALGELKKGISKGIYIEILSDHPSIQKRIDRLKIPKGSDISILFWTAFTLAFVTLLITDSFASITLFFYQDNSYALQEFYESIGIWIHFGIDVLFPVSIILYLYSIRNSIESFGRFIGKSSLCCGGYITLIVGYHSMVALFSSHRLPIPEVATISNHIYFEWSYILFPKLFREPGMILWEKMILLDLPLKFRTALTMWVSGFSVMFLICILMGVLIFVIIFVIQKLPISRKFPSRKGRLLVVVGIQILLIAGCIYVQIPRKSKVSTMEEWIMSFYRTHHEQNPRTGEHVKVGRFDYYVNYDIENTFYAIHILKHMHRLDDLTLNQRDELIRWLQFHQGDNGEFYTGFYFDVEDKARIYDEYYILLSLRDLYAMDAIEREGAIQYALSESDEYPRHMFYLAEILSMLNALDRIDLISRFPVGDYQDECESENGSCFDPCIDGSRFCYDGFRSCVRKGGCLSCTYWNVLALEILNALDIYDENAITDCLLEHYTEDGGFCEEIKIDWLSDPPQMYRQGVSDLKSTFYAVKTLEVQDKLNLDREKVIHYVTSCRMRNGTVKTLEVQDKLNLDREKVIHYVTSCQTRTGGFARTPEGEPTFEDTYYAVEILNALDTLDRLDESYKISDVLLEVFHRLPLVFYLLVGALIAIDFWLYYRVWA